MSKLILFLIFPAVAFGANITAPFDLENGDVLPKGVRNPRVKSIYMTIDERFTPNGSAEALGTKLNKEVTWSDVMSSKTDETEKTVIRGFLSANSIDENGSPGSTTGAVTTTLDVKVPVLAMGVTETWTMALAVPVYKAEIRAETGFIGNAAGQNFIDELSKSSPLKAQETKEQLNDAINGKLQRMGYKRIESETISGIGDMKLVSKLKFRDNGDDIVTWKSEVTLPTGRGPDVDKAVDVSLGDSQWDVGNHVIWDHRLSNSFKLSSNAGINLQLPDQIDRRIPVKSGDSLSEDRERLWRDSGDQLLAGMSLNYSTFENSVLLGLGYSYQYMSKSRYYGTQYAQERYGWLEDLTPEQSLHSATVRAGYSTVDLYKAKKFVYPFQTYIVYSRPFAGVNATNNDVIAGELVLFF